jgi:hypothetical protein
MEAAAAVERDRQVGQETLALLGQLPRRAEQEGLLLVLVREEPVLQRHPVMQERLTPAEVVAALAAALAQQSTGELAGFRAAAVAQAVMALRLSVEPGAQD